MYYPIGSHGFQISELFFWPMYYPLGSLAFTAYGLVFIPIQVCSAAIDFFTLACARSWLSLRSSMAAAVELPCALVASPCPSPSPSSSHAPGSSHGTPSSSVLLSAQDPLPWRAAGAVPCASVALPSAQIPSDRAPLLCCREQPRLADLPVSRPDFAQRPVELLCRVPWRLRARFCPVRVLLAVDIESVTRALDT